MGKIVVGVDGSPGGMAALRFAADEARLRGAELHVVSAWDVPALAYETGIGQPMLDVSEFERHAETTARDTLAEAAPELHDLDVATVHRQGHAAEVLVAEAADADLLVVGSRGLGGFRGLVLGSVSQQCAHQAPCPVVIVPPAAAEERGGHP